MAKTLRVRTRAGWVTKPAPDVPENRLSAEEVDDNFLEMEDGFEAAATAAGTSFDNTASGLTATDVQAAIDEVVDEQGTMSAQNANAVAITGGTVNATTLQQGGSQAYVRSNILGTVSQSGGVPTGAIIERDSNANGEYVKYADGTMICWLYKVVTDQAINNAYGSIFQATRTWNYPVAFPDTPSVSCGLGKWGTGASWSGVSSIDNENALLRFWDISSRASGTGMGIAAIAIGRWF